VGGCGITSLRSKLGPARMGGVISVAAKVLDEEGFESVTELEEAASGFEGFADAAARTKQATGEGLPDNVNPSWQSTMAEFAKAPRHAGKKLAHLANIR
jgi:BRCT domain type II-containing protein